MSKKCGKCGELKDLICFYKGNSKKDGRQSVCKVCIKALNKKYRINNAYKWSKYNYDNIKQRKKCNKCGELKGLNCFNRNKSKKDGMSSYCKTCYNVISIDWSVNNPEKHLIHDAKGKLKHYHNIPNPSTELIQQKIEIIKINRLIKQIENGKD